MIIQTIKRDKNEPCQYCGAPWANHHKGCDKCYGVASTHGNYCEDPLCDCIDFVPADTLTDDDIAVLTGAA